MSENELNNFKYSTFQKIIYKSSLRRLLKGMTPQNGEVKSKMKKTMKSKTGNPKDDGTEHRYDSCGPSFLKKEQVTTAAFRKLKKKCHQKENKQIYRDGKWISSCLDLRDPREGLLMGVRFLCR